MINEVFSSMEKPVAIVKPTPRDPKLVELEKRVRQVARLTVQRKELHEQAKELLSRWETRSDGRAIAKDVKAMDHQVKAALDELWRKLVQFGPDLNQRSFEEFHERYQYFVGIQERDLIDEYGRLLYFNE